MRWLRRVRRSPRVVLLIDGSRSMEASQATALELAVALTGATPRVEVFVFSTALIRLTRELRLAGAGRPRQVTLERATWGGGTSIGANLGAFLRRHGERLVTRDTLAVIVSDGLDVGETGPPQRPCASCTGGRPAVWLNPLATPGRADVARCAARPFIKRPSRTSAAPTWCGSRDGFACAYAHHGSSRRCRRQRRRPAGTGQSETREVRPNRRHSSERCRSACRGRISG